MLVLYGSQTGCAQEVAERIAWEGKRRLFRVRLAGAPHGHASAPVGAPRSAHARMRAPRASGKTWYPWPGPPRRTLLGAPCLWVLWVRRSARAGVLAVTHA
jgi:hypothetical protein